MATCPGVLGGRGVETCGPVPPLSHTPEFVLSVISSSHDAHSTRILMLWERENDGEGRQRNRQRKREALQAFWLKMLSFVASSDAVCTLPLYNGPPRSLVFAPVCAPGGGAEAGRSVHGVAVHVVRRVHWPGAAGWVQAMAVVVHGLRHSAPGLGSLQLCRQFCGANGELDAGKLTAYGRLSRWR